MIGWRAAFTLLVMTSAACVRPDVEGRAAWPSLAPLVGVPDEDWPMFRDDLERSGFAEGSTVGSTVSVAWEIPRFNVTRYGAAKGSPSIVGDTLYCGTD